MSGHAKKRKWTYRNEKDVSIPITHKFLNFAFGELKNYYCVLNNIENEASTFSLHNDLITNISKTRSINEILKACPCLSYSYNNPATTDQQKYDGFHCTLCSNDLDRTGRFIYSHLEEVSFGGKSQKEPNQTTRFKNLKTSIRTHLLSETHCSKAIKPQEDEQATNADLIKHMEDMMTFFEMNKKETVTVCPVKQKAKSDQSKVVSSCKSVSDVVKASEHLAFCFRSKEDEASKQFIGVQCVPCYNISLQKMKHIEKIADKSSKVFGLFHFHYSNGLNFGGKKFNQENQTQQFNQLKESISTHLSSKSHLHVVQEERQMSNSEVELLQRKHDIGITIGLVALKSIVSYQSKTSYEREITFLSDIGVDVGDINHGRDFVDSLCSHLYETLKDQAVLVLNKRLLPHFEASPFVVFADKLTPFASTLQVIGIIMLQEMQNTAIVLDVKQVDHLVQNGKALAQDIVKTILQFYSPEVAKRLYVGCSFDGQYHTLNVPEEILKLLKIQVDSSLSKDQLAETQFHTYSWDPAHLIELACQDVKKTKKFEWVEKVEQSIVAINKTHTYGKRYLQLMEEAQQIQAILLRPGSFSETRFCAYKFKVLYRFWNNYATLYNKLSHDGDDDLNFINNSQFCLRLCGLLDIFKLVGGLSKQIQSSKIFPWECDSKIEESVEALYAMASSLKATSFKPNNLFLKYFNEGLQEIMTKASFKEKGVYYKQPVVYMTRSKSVLNSSDTGFESVKKRVINELQLYITAIADAIQQRYFKNHSQKSFVFARDSFSAEKIVARQVGVVPESFQKYCEMAKMGGFISDVLQADLDCEYAKFVTRLHFIHNTYRNNASAIPENRLLWEVINTAEIRDCKNVVSLLASAIVRNKSECIAESIGNLIKQHLVHRCGLSNRNLAMEIFLRFNGPNPNRQANWLVDEAMNKRFGGQDWHVLRTSSPLGLKHYEKSKVVDRIHQFKSKIGFTLDELSGDESDGDIDL